MSAGAARAMAGGPESPASASQSHDGDAAPLALAKETLGDASRMQMTWSATYELRPMSPWLALPIDLRAGDAARARETPAQRVGWRPMPGFDHGWGEKRVFFETLFGAVSQPADTPAGIAGRVAKAELDKNPMFLRAMARLPADQAFCEQTAVPIREWILRAMLEESAQAAQLERLGEDEFFREADRANANSEPRHGAAQGFGGSERSGFASPAPEPAMGMAIASLLERLGANNDNARSRAIEAIGWLSRQGGAPDAPAPVSLTEAERRLAANGWAESARLSNNAAAIELAIARAREGLALAEQHGWVGRDQLQELLDRAWAMRPSPKERATRALCLLEIAGERRLRVDAARGAAAAQAWGRWASWEGGRGHSARAWASAAEMARRLIERATLDGAAAEGQAEGGFVNGANSPARRL
jgi:hypothetical protein